MSLIEDLKRDEGRKDKPYPDSRGIQTIGYGHNLDAEGLCEAALLVQLQYDIQTKALGPLDRNLAWWRGMPEPAQDVLANMCFNLGLAKLLTFRRFLKLLEAHQYRAAAAEMLDSQWAKQVGARAVRLASVLRAVV